MFGFASSIQICIVQCYPATRYSTNEVNIFKLISLLSFHMFSDKPETLQTSLENILEDEIEETGCLSDVVQIICTGG